MPSKKQAALQILLSGFCFGFLGLWGKWAFSLGIAPGELLGLRFLLAAIVLFSFLWWRGMPRLSRTQIWTCLGLGVFGYAVFSSCYFFALKGLSVSLTVLLLYLYPVIVAVGARVFLNEHLGPKGRVALPLAVVGTVLLVWGEFTVTNAWSFVAGVMSAIIYSVYILISRKALAQVDGWASAAWMQLGTGVVLSLLYFRSFDRVVEAASVAWLPIVGIALISTVLAMSLFLQGLKALKAAEASILNTSEPLVAILAAAILLGEKLSMVQIIGGVLVLAAMVLIAVRPAPTPN